MFINGSHIFTNVFILPVWVEKIRCTAQRMPLLCWFLFIFHSHFNRYFFAILVFRYDPPQYVKTESGRRDRLAECVDVCPHVHRPFLVKNLRVFKFLSTTVCGKKFIYLLYKLRLCFTILFRISRETLLTLANFLLHSFESHLPWNKQ